MKIEKEFSIGEVARHVGARQSALRYYERVGLIPPARRVSRRRVYDESVFESIAVIQLAKDAGFTIDETRLLLSGFGRSVPASERWRMLAQGKIEEMTARIERAERMRAVLERLSRCRCETLGECVRARADALTCESTPPRH